VRQPGAACCTRCARTNGQEGLKVHALAAVLAVLCHQGLDLCLAHIAAKGTHGNLEFVVVNAAHLVRVKQAEGLGQQGGKQAEGEGRVQATVCERQVVRSQPARPESAAPLTSVTSSRCSGVMVLLAAPSLRLGRPPSLKPVDKEEAAAAAEEVEPPPANELALSMCA
jgi:hypothetical protein